MVLAGTSAGWEAHTGKPRQLVVHTVRKESMGVQRPGWTGAIEVCLIRKDTRVTRVVTVWPHAFVGRTVAWAPKISLRPQARPVACDGMSTWQDGRELVVGALEADLVPGLHHSRAKVEVVGLLLLDSDGQRASGRVDRLWGVPLVIASTPVPEVNRLPVWIISRPESTALGLKLVAKYQVPGGSILSTGSRHSGLGCVGINETALKVCCVSLSTRFAHAVWIQPPLNLYEDRVAHEQHQERHGDCGQGKYVQDTS